MDEIMNASYEYLDIPMLPMRNIVVFPFMTTPFFIGRQQSIEALEKALATDRKVFVIAQKLEYGQALGGGADAAGQIGKGVAQLVQVARQP